MVKKYNICEVCFFVYMLTKYDSPVSITVESSNLVNIEVFYF